MGLPAPQRMKNGHRNTAIKTICVYWHRALPANCSATLSALHSLNDGLKYNPKSSSIYFSLGSVLAVMERYQEAISHFQVALDLGCTCKDVAYFDIGNAYLQQRDWSPAVEYYEKVLEIDPRYLKAHKNLVMALCHAGTMSGRRLKPRACWNWTPKGNMVCGRERESISCNNSWFSQE